MRRAEYLRPLLQDRPEQVGRDRLEILTALIGGPSFDPAYRPDIIMIPGGHPIYRWECLVASCERPRTGGADMCSQHQQDWARDSERGIGKAAFVTAAVGLDRHVGAQEHPCRICAARPAVHSDLLLCQRHLGRWNQYSQVPATSTDFDDWLSQEQPFPGYGNCVVAVCPNLAGSPLRLCAWHTSRYHRDGDPGAAGLPSAWWQRYEQHAQPVPIAYGDEAVFGSWCARAPAQPWSGQISLRGLRPLVRAEIAWGLFVHTQRKRPTRWDLGWIRSLVTTCRAGEVNSLVDFEFGAGGSAEFTGAIAKEILHELRLVYFTPGESKDAGFVETEHYGVRFPHRMSHIDLSGIPQRWLRDLTWDHMVALLQSTNCPRTASPFDALRRAAIELGTFLQVDAPGGGHDPAALRGEHMHRFVADQRHREREGLASLVITRLGGAASIVTTTTRSVLFNAARKLLREAMDTGLADQLGLDREFIIAVPSAGATTGRTARRPFPDEVAMALADESNLAELAAAHDVNDGGARDIWETTVITGRRIGEVIAVRWDCLGRYGGLAMFWHDQTKVGNYDAAIRIPERLYEILAKRQRTTLERYTARHGHHPSAAQRAGLALFPTTYRSNDGTVSLTHLECSRFCGHRFTLPTG